MNRLVLLLSFLALSGCPSKARPGDACRTNEACSSLEHGYCAKIEICTRACDEATACPLGAACVTKGVRHVCLATCTVNAGCIKGFACQSINGTSVCESADPLAPPPA